MLTNCRLAFKTGLIVLALSVGACGSSSGGTTGTGGGGGAAAGAGGGSAGVTGTAGADGGAGAAGVDGGGDATEGGALTAAQVHDMLINAPSANGVMITRAAPKDYATCH